MIAASKKIQEQTVQYYKDIDKYGEQRVEKCVELANMTTATYRYYLAIASEDLDGLIQIVKDRNSIPKEPGWYWLDNPIVNSEPVIVQVFVRPGHKYLCINSPHVCQHTKSDFLAVEQLGNLWSPKIEEYFK